MFSKILIANRGEIACRVIRTARRMGISTVAVYSDADRSALHVDMADEAIAIGAAPARDSYLRADRIVAAAIATGAQAIHPGYGFLSENADFADACVAAGIVFIGPPSSAIRAMGSKAAAKALMAKAGVPLVPGYHGAAQDMTVFRDASDKIGYPVLIKASAGGGGKGMRIVDNAAALHAAIEGAAHEARASFGDDRLLIEKYLTRPRHIEIQVFADTHGNCISLFERDCSIQRRHQKVLEESPAPFMTEDRRHGMGQAAIAAAQAVGYAGAGTVEFIAENDAYFFMEMNTRLQVEHPVTEMVTGLDLVEWQLRVADGQTLPEAPAAPQGHAIEARIYAEDPARDFLPSIGTLIHLRTPAYVRIDSGVREGDAITPFYDPMIAKLIVHAPDRPQAVRKLAVALDAFEIAGVRSNLALLRAIAADPAYAAGDVDTGFIFRHPEVLSEPEATGADTRIVIAAATLDLLAGQTATAQAADPHSPWDDADSWRLNGAPIQDIQVECDGKHIPVRISGVTLTLPDATLTAERISPTAIRVDGAVHRLSVVRDGNRRIVIHRGRNSIVTVVDPLAPPRAQEAAMGSLAAPIPARVTRILCAVGDMVAKGAVLLTLEAMKMELTIAAPFDGTVTDMRHAAGDMVQEGTILAVLTPAETA
jgi:3-methylcrotonyl-CoA carboxylase alpha subunit